MWNNLHCFPVEGSSIKERIIKDPLMHECYTTTEVLEKSSALPLKFPRKYNCHPPLYPALPPSLPPSLSLCVLVALRPWNVPLLSSQPIPCHTHTLTCGDRGRALSLRHASGALLKARRMCVSVTCRKMNTTTAAATSVEIRKGRRVHLLFEFHFLYFHAF